MANIGENHGEVLPPLTFGGKAETTVEPIKCLQCEKCYTFPVGKDDYLAHLFLEHRLVIADIDDVPFLEEYLQFWTAEFQDHELEVYCTTMLLDQLPDGTPAKNERYYLLSDILPKDYELRKRLQGQRLAKALGQHQFERTDRSFSKECLYCRDVITGLRSDFLAHLFQKHFLQLGKPENLVYVDELLAKVQQNLEQLICLYCAKIFKDRVTLKEHMRKKAHKRINPNNRDYDRFFLTNYRNERTKPQKRLPKRRHDQPAQYQVAKDQRPETDCAASELAPSVDFEQRRRLGAAAQSDDSDSDWSDWAGEQQPPLNCLYCTQQDAGYDQFKEHLRTAHGVDFEASLCALNFYQRIKVVNYVRRQVCLLRCVACNARHETAALLLEHMAEAEHFGIGTQKQWDKPEFFFPTYDDDGLLCILDDSPNDDVDETVVRVISEDTLAQINKDAERLSLENFQY